MNLPFGLNAAKVGDSLSVIPDIRRKVKGCPVAPSSFSGQFANVMLGSSVVIVKTAIERIVKRMHEKVIN